MATSQTQTARKQIISPVAIIAALFFIFGFVTWMNSILIPYLKIACQLNNFESYFVAFAFYIAYLVMAVPASAALKIFGFKNGMAVGLVIMAIGALIFIPAALTRTYVYFLAGLFIQGTGLAVLQTASNPYITILGPAESAAKRISIMGICNKLAGAIAPIILGAIALKDVDGLVIRLKTMNSLARIEELNNLAARVIVPYLVIVVVLLLLAVFIYYSSLPEIDTEREDDNVLLSNSGKTSIIQFPHLMLGVVTLFLYVGAEVLAGDSIVSYGYSQHISLNTARFFSTCTLCSMIIGYIIGITCIPRYFTQQKALIWSAILGVILTVLALTTSGYVSVLCIALLGLANSLMWPAIWPLALAGLGRFTKIASSLLVMGIAGGALIPLLFGKLVDVFSNQLAFIILLPIYLFILYYSIAGYKVGKLKYTKSIEGVCEHAH
jgi:FHS family L-fucose permease-like MFS transporter